MKIMMIFLKFNFFMDYSQWQIVLLKFPFTNLEWSKIRLALIISNDGFNKKDNLLLIWIYWNKGSWDYSMELSQEDLSFWRLKKKSFFRFHNVFSLEKSLVQWVVSKVNDAKLKRVKDRFCSFVV